jgi:CubicO group peptidase (beta-lactamase class C family)
MGTSVDNVSADVEDLSELLAEVRAKHRVPAVAAAMARSDGLAACGAVGRRKSRSREAVAAGDRFHLGSCTKSMTATLCAILVERGLLRWESTIAEVLGKEGAHPKFHGVTLEQLVCHRSGLAEDRRPDLVTWPRVLLLTGDLPERRRAFVKIALARAPVHEPGSAFAYSNYGFTIAGAMCEAATGESYERLMRRWLFEPLGMTTAGFGAPGEDHPQPWGHDALLGSYLPVPPGPGSDNPQVIAPAGTVHCSIEDWARYARLHLKGARGTAELLKPESFAKLHSDLHKQDYGFGWVIAEEAWAGGKVLVHDGSNGRWYAFILIAPERDVAMVVATNAGDEAAVDACRGVIRGLRQKYVAPAPEDGIEE